MHPILKLASNIKKDRAERLLIRSIRDSLVTGSFACPEGMGGASAGGTDPELSGQFLRRIAFHDLRSSRRDFIFIAMTGSGPGILCGQRSGSDFVQLKCRSHGLCGSHQQTGGRVGADWCRRSPARVISAIELILITGLLISLEAAPGTGSDTSQLTPNSNIRSAVPTKPEGVVPTASNQFLACFAAASRRFVCYKSRKRQKLSSAAPKPPTSTKNDDD